MSKSVTGAQMGCRPGKLRIRHGPAVGCMERPLIHAAPVTDSHTGSRSSVQAPT